MRISSGVFVPGQQQSVISVRYRIGFRLHWGDLRALGEGSGSRSKLCKKCIYIYIYIARRAVMMVQAVAAAAGGGVVVVVAAAAAVGLRGLGFRPFRV